MYCLLLSIKATKCEGNLERSPIKQYWIFSCEVFAHESFLQEKQIDFILWSIPIFTRKCNKARTLVFIQCSTIGSRIFLDAHRLFAFDFSWQSGCHDDGNMLRKMILFWFGHNLHQFCFFRCKTFIYFCNTVIFWISSPARRSSSSEILSTVPWYHLKHHDECYEYCIFSFTACNFLHIAACF